MVDRLKWANNETLAFRRLRIPDVLEFAQVGRTCVGLVPRLTLDFSKCKTALPQQMIPLMVVAKHLQQSGLELGIKLPHDQTVAALFRNTGWAHAIDPDAYPAVPWRSHHVPLTTFSTSEEQHQTVNRVLHELIEHVVLDREFLRALEWSLNEITDNVLKHAEQPGFVQVTLFEDHLAFAVGDTGRGIPNSLREASTYRALSDVEALEQATMPGVTNGRGQGNGLAGLRHIALAAAGDVQIFSHGAYGSVHGKDESVEFQQMRDGGIFPGTAVVLVLPTAGGWSLQEALRFQHPDWEPIDLLETEYEDFDHPNVFIVRLSLERRGVGSREAGDALRQKCLNLLGSGSEARLVLDFSDVRMVASSFADALIGKLLVSLGRDAFERRVVIVGVNDGVAPVVRGAVSQRVRSDLEV